MIIGESNMGNNIAHIEHNMMLYVVILHMNSNTAHTKVLLHIKKLILHMI